jgi:DHA1 family inner membrane transport protein
MAALAVCHVASALAPSFSVLLTIRLVEMAFAAVFTPQAASAIAMMVPERERPGAISFVFLGWSLSAAVGMPAVAWAASEYGWRSVHWGLALVAALAAIAVLASVPRNLRGVAMSLASWGSLLRDPFVLTLLLATILAGTGQFVIFTFFAPLLSRTVMASPAEIATCFAVFGVAGFLGNIAATRLVGRIGALNTSLIFFGALLAGAVIWALATGSVTLALIASFVWGLGFAASNSMQQARLATAVPALAGGVIALNSSSIYIGQASGSAIGGAMFDRGLFVAMGWAGVAFLLATLAACLVERAASNEAGLSLRRHMRGQFVQCFRPAGFMAVANRHAVEKGLMQRQPRASAEIVKPHINGRGRGGGAVVLFPGMGEDKAADRVHLQVGAA